MSTSGPQFQSRQDSTPPLDPPPPVHADVTQIVKNLSYLSTWDVASPYRCYFLLHNANEDMYSFPYGDIVTGPPSDYYEPYAWSPFGDEVSNNSLILQYQKSLEDNPLFQSHNDMWRLFVGMDNLPGLQLPFQAAVLLTNSFLSGFAVRAILGKYSDKRALQHLSPLVLSLGPPKTNAAGNTEDSSVIDQWFKTELLNWSKALQDSNEWVKISDKDSHDYMQALSRLTQGSFQLAGILMGWRFGDQVYADDTHESFATAAWNLINSRHTTKEIGAMVGYSLDYLAGFLNNERVLDLSSSNPTYQYAQVDYSKADNIYVRYSFHMITLREATLDVVVPQNFKLVDLAARFHYLILNEFYAIGMSDDYPNKPTALASYAGFLEGYQQGSLQAADSLCALLYRAGFAKGYKEGYSVGYATGFSAGYAQGYAAGWQAGYSQGQGSWSGVLNQVVGGISDFLDDAKQVAEFASEAVGTGGVLVDLWELAAAR